MKMIRVFGWVSLLFAILTTIVSAALTAYFLDGYPAGLAEAYPQIARFQTCRDFARSSLSALYITYYYVGLLMVGVSVFSIAFAYRRENSQIQLSILVPLGFLTPFLFLILTDMIFIPKSFVGSVCHDDFMIPLIVFQFAYLSFCSFFIVGTAKVIVYGPRK